MFKNKLMALVIVLVAVMALGVVGCEVDEDPDAAPEESFRNIQGIESGAGIMINTEEAIEEYDLELDLSEASGAAMTAELQTAIENDEWIVVTGWTPHWKFAEWELKFLEDPEDVYGEAEEIMNLARQGLEDDHPEVYAFLENFYWGDDEIGAVMGMHEDDDDFLANSQQWMEENQDIVDGWLPEGFGDEAEGQTVSTAYVEGWDCARASAYMATAVLEDAGYEVELDTLDAGIVWTELAEGDRDFFNAGWLPNTHGDYEEEHGDNVDQVSVHYDDGARIGLVVPEYVDIDSIEELNDYVQ